MISMNMIKTHLTTILTFLLFLLCCSTPFCPAASTSDSLPKSWLEQWNHPGVEMRPLQIVHGGIVSINANQGFASLKNNFGLGGIVCNVGPQNYLRNEQEWERFVDAVKNARKEGLRVWIYDEDGYPSLEAGGVVLEENLHMQCYCLAYDPTLEQPFIVRPAYEFTHAANNYAAARRYPNPLYPDATRRFLQVTHDQYKKHLGEELLGQIEAFFTDEPSLNAVNIGQIPESARLNVRTDDPLDPTLVPLPMVPWCNDIREKYQEKYGEDLIPVRKSLFEGQTPKDREVRQKFWSLIADLNTERFYGAIEDWCKKSGSSFPTIANPAAPLKLAASGHTLHEEPTHGHVPLDGNKMQVMNKFDVPGLDLLNSDPRAVFWGAWRAAAYPASAADFMGRRLVMTEVSDFSQIMGGEGEVDLASMCATAAWQAAWGVTEFTLYYGMDKRGAEIYKQYCDFVGRLNAILRSATPIREVALYYPIGELQEEYLPHAEPLSLENQSQRTRQLVRTFEQLGAEMMQRQIPFVLTESLKPTTFDGQRRILVKNDLLPLEGVAMPQIEPGSPEIVLARFARDHRDIFLLLNVSKEPYKGQLTVPTEKSARNWLVLDPLNGSIRSVPSTWTNDVATIPFALESKQTLILVGE